MPASPKSPLLRSKGFEPTLSPPHDLGDLSGYPPKASTPALTAHAGSNSRSGSGSGSDSDSTSTSDSDSDSDSEAPSAALRSNTRTGRPPASPRKNVGRLKGSRDPVPRRPLTEPGKSQLRKMMPGRPGRKKKAVVEEEESDSSSSARSQSKTPPARSPSANAVPDIEILPPPRKRAKPDSGFEDSGGRKKADTCYAALRNGRVLKGRTHPLELLGLKRVCPRAFLPTPILVLFRFHCVPSVLETVRRAASQPGISADRIVLINFTDNLEPLDREFLMLEDLVELGQSKKHEHQFTEFTLKPGEGKTKVPLYFPLSRTTCVPKMVAIPHAAFISNVIQTAAHDAGIDMSVPVVERRFKPGNVLCLIMTFKQVLPMFRGEIQPQSTLMPPILTLFCKHPAMKNADLSSLRVIFVGAAPVSVHLAEAMGALVPQAVVEQGYGMSELTGILTMPPFNRRVATEAVGNLLPGCTTRVDKPDGSLAGVGETGELYVTGLSLATNYLNNEQLIDACQFQSNIRRWVSGDAIHDHRLTFRQLVAPAELEARLVANADITECCVVGVTHEFSGEVPKAYVVLTKDALERICLESEEGNRIKMFLIEDMATNKAKYKTLVGVIEFIDVIPKTSSGKLLRRALRTVL
ncbi:hypothetical protein DFH06DRAFT_1297501 [Mycena polygramma]|nr:hypothetical protein DFH06DRAFT_1297501 [Mycena polygramma]